MARVYRQKWRNKKRQYETDAGTLREDKGEREGKCRIKRLRRWKTGADMLTADKKPTLLAVNAAISKLVLS